MCIADMSLSLRTFADTKTLRRKFHECLEKSRFFDKKNRVNFWNAVCDGFLQMCKSKDIGPN